jgi:hypothetical protein
MLREERRLSVFKNKVLRRIQQTLVIPRMSRDSFNTCVIKNIYLIL